MRWIVPGWPSWYLSAGHWTQSTGHLNSGAASLKSASWHSPCPDLCFKNAQYLFCSRTESQLPCSSTTKQCAQTQSITALDDRKVIFGILELCCTQGHISQSGCPDHNVIGLKDDAWHTWRKTRRNFKASSLHFGKYILWSAFPTFWKERGISEAWRRNLVCGRPEICWDYLLASDATTLSISKCNLN